jgi:uncharacterized integral membrane protein (TIGR00697 family)
MKKENKLMILLALYVGALFGSNLLGGKLMPLGFSGRGLSVSIIMFPFLFLITDIVGEVYGRKKAKEFVNIGLMSLVVLLVWQLFANIVPGAVPNPWYETYNAAYSTVFGLSITFTIASIAAFFFGQWVDVFIYHFIKKKWGKKNIWLRNNVSTFIGQFIDTSLWMIIAFFPKLLDGSFEIFSMYSTMIIPYWLAKVVFAIIDTPLVYVGINWLRGSKKKTSKN